MSASEIIECSQIIVNDLNKIKRVDVPLLASIFLSIENYSSVSANVG